MESSHLGIHPGANLNLFSDEEMQIIQKLSQEWFVTAGGTVSPGASSTYQYVLIKPAKNYQELFNLDREIVVIFSRYTTFEPRTLDAIDHVINRQEALRVERICSVVISKDEEVEQKLRDLLKNEESQVVIPFSYTEMLESHDPFFVRNRFKEHFYARDLFAFESALKKDIYFFGRKDLVHEIANRQ